MSNPFDEPERDFNHLAAYRNQHVQNQINSSQDATLESSRRALQILAQTEQTGAQTSNELATQGEKLARGEDRLEEIAEMQKNASQSIQILKSFTSFFFSRTPKPTATTTTRREEAPPTSISLQCSASNPALQQQQKDFSGAGPASKDARRAEFDSNLNQMGAILSNISNMSQAMNQELKVQNNRLDRMNDKTEHLDSVTRSQTEALNKLLKK
ncbi:Synaptosomal-associated protein [Cichlidogyrus casuarinus]|uniref:Synaptosomal-associated protein n=1 Tax=Cichlidogyrus casuarinus TaxID=1844966 RepID=A0ABD2QJD8_9PLAT